MKNKSLKYIFSLILFSVLLMVGCGSGGGQSVLQQESPEDAVMRISNTWRASTDSPAVVVDANNRFVRQARDLGTDSNNSSNTNPNSNIIYLKDLAGGKPYELKVIKVEKSDNKSEVTSHFDYEKGTLIIVFKLIFDEEKWWLDDVVIRDEELGEKEAYCYISHIGPDNEKLFDEEKITKTIGDSVLAKDYAKDDDKYVFDSENTIDSIIISGSSDNSLVILYQRREAQFTVVYNFFDEKGNIISDKTVESTNTGYVGDTIDLTEIENDISFDGYEKTSGPESLVISRKEDLNKFVFEYQKIKKDDPELEYTISGVVTDKNNNNKPIPNAVIKFFIVDENAQKGYSELYYNDNSNEQVQITTDSEGKYDTSKIENAEFKEGTYLLVVEVRGYESQTIKVKLPKESKENNFRANISL